MLAFPSTYSVGITSLGYQVVWASMARRPDLDVRRLFTDQEIRSTATASCLGCR